MAAKQYDDAAASFLKPVALAPRDMRWPYYLGQRAVMTKDFTQAAEWFERVLELAPSDEPTLVWLGRVNLDQSRFDDADRLFAHATLVAPQSAAAWAVPDTSPLPNKNTSVPSNPWSVRSPWIPAARRRTTRWRWRIAHSATSIGPPRALTTSLRSGSHGSVVVVHPS